MMKNRLLSVALAIFMNSTMAVDMPNVPGAINPNVTQNNIQTTICASGWTKTIRPSTYQTTKIKKAKYAQFNLTGGISAYELDHLISIELGGHPSDPNNLWLEAWDGPAGARTKDVLETALKRDVCAGRITLLYAQQVIAKDWVSEYNLRYPKTPIKK